MGSPKTQLRGSISTTSAARRDPAPVFHQWGRCWGGETPPGDTPHEGVTDEMLLQGVLVMPEEGSRGSTGAHQKPEPKGSSPARRAGWDVAGRDFRQLSDTAKQTLAKSS